MNRRKKYIIKATIALIVLLIGGIGLGFGVRYLIQGILTDAISNGNIMVFLIVAFVCSSFMYKLLMSMSFAKMQLLRNYYITDKQWATKYQPVDIMVPVLGHFRSLFLFNETLYDTVGDKDSMDLPFYIFTMWIKIWNIILVVLFHLVLFGEGIYIYTQYGFFRFIDIHSMYVTILYLIGMFIITNTSLMYIAYTVAYKNKIYSFNPSALIGTLLVMPTIFVINVILILLMFVFKLPIPNIPLFNILGFILLPVIQPLIIRIAAGKLNSEVITNIRLQAKKKSRR